MGLVSRLKEQIEDLKCEKRSFRIQISNLKWHIGELINKARKDDSEIKKLGLENSDLRHSNRHLAAKNRELQLEIKKREAKLKRDLEENEAVFDECELLLDLDIQDLVAKNRKLKEQNSKLLKAINSLIHSVS